MAIVKKEKGSTVKKKTTGGRKEESADAVRFELPTERTEPKGSIGDYTWLIMGEKKIGKTSLTAQMGEVLHGMTEPGGKALSLYEVPLSDWATFRKMIRALKRKRDQYDTVVIDVADRLYPMCDDYVCEKLVIQDLAEEDWGKGWREMKKEFEREITELLNLGMGVVFISHVQEQEIETRDGRKYDRIMPTMHKRMRELIEGVVDIWAYYTYDRRRRVLVILGDDHVSAGHRLEGRFQTADGKPIRQIDMGTSAKQGYRNIVDAFHNRYVPTKATDVDDPEQEAPAKKKKMKLRRTV